MKTRKRRLIYIISAMLLLVCLYQLYWLIGQYQESKRRMADDINEVLRSADFEELVHRVDEISRMNFKGNVAVNMGYDHSDEGTIVKSDVSDSPQPDEHTGGTKTVVSPATFGSILRTPDDLMRMGLNMQRGIHLSLDGIREVDLAYLDRKITEKLDSLGVGSEHTLLYIRSGEPDKSVTDTLAKLGSLQRGAKDTFSLELPGNAEYQMIIPSWHLAVVHKMLPVILFSLVTLLLLSGAFLYMIHVMRRQKELEDIKTDFTNNITHELKTPIAVAYAANDALLNFGSADNTPRMQRYLNVCQQQLRLLDRLVEQILSLSMERRNSLILNTESVDIGQLIDGLCETYMMKYPDAVHFTISCEPGLAVESDMMHLSNIVGNVIDNAVKYSKGVAKVSILATRGDAEGVMIEISDEGIGMTADQMKHIFEKFYRVPHGNVHDVKGYGLGLFYVKSMMERLGGTVEVSSVPGKGSTFTLTFGIDSLTH